MSFYVYYGKIKDELFVTVLPNGTFELNDPVWIYSSRDFSSYKVTSLETLDNGEERVRFYNAFHSYEAVSKKEYRELSITKNNRVGDSASLTMTRSYAQPLTTLQLIDAPKIWTGMMNYQSLAKNEPFVIVAPKGVGAGKPVVAIGQWTKDDNGVAKAVSFCQTEQYVDITNPKKFSFTQGENLTFTCEVDAGSNKALKTTIGAPKGLSQAQTPFILSSELTYGADHLFTPPQLQKDKVAVDCTRPQAKPALPRITSPLPFPGDLIKTLTWSAAFVDQAGYLAKYAVEQFDQLDRSFNNLEKKSEARGARILELEAANTKLRQANKDAKASYSALEADLVKERAEAAKREGDLNKQLADLKDLLQNAEAKIKEQSLYIDMDKVNDDKLKNEWDNLKAADNATIDRLRGDLLKATAKTAALRIELNEKNDMIRAYGDKMRKLEDDLLVAGGEIAELKFKLEALGLENNKLHEDIKRLEHLLSQALKDNRDYQTIIAQKEATIRELQKTIDQLNAEIKSKDTTIGTKTSQITSLGATIKGHETSLAKIREEKSELNDAYIAETASKNRLERLWQTSQEKVSMYEKAAQGTTVTTQLNETLSTENATLQKAYEAELETKNRLQSLYTALRTDFEKLHESTKHGQPTLVGAGDKSKTATNVTVTELPPPAVA